MHKVNLVLTVLYSIILTIVPIIDMYINVMRHMGCMPYVVILSGITLSCFDVIINMLT